jgi:hypothetical protein
MSEQNENPEEFQLDSVFETIKQLDLNGEKEGLIAIGYVDLGEQTSVRATIHGKKGQLVQTLAAALDSDRDLRDLFQKAMLYSMAKQVGQD